MGDVLPFPPRTPRAIEPRETSLVLGCRCAIARGRFIAEPGCPIHRGSFPIDSVVVRPLNPTNPSGPA